MKFPSLSLESKITKRKETKTKEKRRYFYKSKLVIWWFERRIFVLCSLIQWALVNKKCNSTYTAYLRSVWCLIRCMQAIKHIHFTYSNYILYSVIDKLFLICTQPTRKYLINQIRSCHWTPNYKILNEVNRAVPST